MNSIFETIYYNWSYRVERKLGSGNYGTAYLVYDDKANKNKGEEEW